MRKIEVGAARQYTPAPALLLAGRRQFEVVVHLLY